MPKASWVKLRDPFQRVIAAGVAIAGEIAHGTEHAEDRKSTRLNSSHGYISYAVFCLKKKKNTHSRGPVVAGTCILRRCLDKPDRRHSLCTFHLLRTGLVITSAAVLRWWRRRGLPSPR